MSGDMPKRTVVFTGDYLLNRAVGVNRYCTELLGEFDDIMDRDHRLDVVLLIPRNTRLDDVPYNHVRVVRRGREANKIEKYVWRHLTFPLYVRGKGALGVDLCGDMPLWGCDVSAILDCIHERFPENFEGHRFSLQTYLLKVKASIRHKSRLIVTLTRSSMDDIMRFYEIDPSRMRIVGCGWEHIARVEEDDSLSDRFRERPYFFSLGSKYRHKNFEWVIRAARKNPQYDFVVSGEDSFSDEGARLAGSKPENVYFTGFLTDGQIKGLMRHCRAFIQPSLCEGFGIPPLEALALGSDIVVSDVSSLPEVYGTSAYYIDPNSDGCDLDELLSQGKPYGREDVLERYTWHNAAGGLWRVLLDRCRIR